MNFVNYYGNEVKYRVQRTGYQAQGALVTGLVKLGLGGGAATVGSSIGAGGAPVFLSAGAGVLGMAAGVGINAYLNHMEHRHHEEQICERFRDEFASLAGKTPADVKIHDLKKIAHHNPVFEQELTRSRQTRNLKNGAVVLGTVAAFGAVLAATALIPAVGALAVAGGLTSLAFAAVSTVAGLGVLGAVRNRAMKIGKKMLHLDEPTPMDRIRQLSKELKQDKAISQQQVMDVFVAARPELDEKISAAYGRSYHMLNSVHRQQATEEFGKEYNIETLTYMMNSGNMRVQELAFTTQGQSSGYIPPAPLGDRVREIISDVKDDLVDRVQDWRQDRQISKLSSQIEKAVEEGGQLPSEALLIAPESTWRDLVTAQRRQTEKAPAR